MEENKMKKIIMFETHFAWVDKEVLKALDDFIDSEYGRNEKTRTSWIKDECKAHLGIDLKNKDSLEDMNDTLKEKHYSHKAEWLKERIRININSKKQEEDDDGKDDRK